MTTYDGNVAATVRAFCDRHADKVSSVTRGNRRDDWAYMAYLCAGWNDGNDVVHSVIADDAKDLIARLRCVAPCNCDECRARLAELEGTK